MPGLGRIYAPDERDRRYPMAAALPETIDVEVMYWDDDAWWGDQGETPQCVGYSWAHWLEDGPIVHWRLNPPVVDPGDIYRGAQLLDEWEGEDYEGTSVRAGAKYLHNLLYIGEYRWAATAEEVAAAVLTVGPVVIGSIWTEGMFYPDEDYIIHPMGDIVGGHAYLLNGYDSRTGLFRVKNSWGWLWGESGHAYLHIQDLDWLLQDQGEACLAIEQPIGPTPLPDPEPEPTPEPKGSLFERFVEWLKWWWNNIIG